MIRVANLQLLEVHMFNHIIKLSGHDNYNITVIDHVTKTKSKLSLDDAINSINYNMGKFDSVIMSEALHDTLSSAKQYTPAKSTIVVTHKPSGVLAKRTINYSDSSSLNCKFATPDIFIDKIEVTVPISKKEGKQFQALMLLLEEEKRWVTHRKHANAKHVKYRESFTIQSSNSGRLMILIKPVSYKINRLKITFNPSAYSHPSRSPILM